VRDEHDLIVVGAGPGGSSAAAAALRAGLSVVQLEAARFPRVKPCAGGLTPKALRALPDAAVPAASGAFREFEFNAWRGRRTVFSFHAPCLSMVERPRFDLELVERNLERPGFRFYDGEPVRAIDWDGARFRVRSAARTLLGRTLVGADGANGIVNRVFRASRPRGGALAVEVVLRRSELVGASPARPCFDFGLLPRGYGWVFPKDERVSVGLYTLKRGQKDLRARLAEYLAAKGLRVRGDALAGFVAHTIPLGGFRLRDPGAPVFVVGDAGGFADALTGEGIYHALESGRIAGECAALVGRGELAHGRYPQRLRRSVLRDTEWTWRLSGIFYRDPAAWLRLLRLGPVWRPLVHGTGSGATFSACLTRGAEFLARSLLGHTARRAGMEP
jgi:geranylgeranyl reductase family protein